MQKDDAGAASGQQPASQAKPTYRRKKVVVNRGFQFKYAIIMFALFGVAAFMVWWEVYNNFKSVMDQGLIHDAAAIRLMSDVTRLVLYKSALALGIVWFLSILLSHYIAGPIYRFEACLKLLKSGDLAHRARLRPHDELKELAATYNDAIESIQSRVRSINEAANGGDARAALERIKKIAGEFKV